MTAIADTTTETRRFDYLALNLKRVAGPVLESKLNALGDEGFEAVCTAGNYLVFKRPKAG